MEWTRGLLRLWIVFAVACVAVGASLAIQAFLKAKSDTEAIALGVARPSPWNQFQDLVPAQPDPWAQFKEIGGAPSPAGSDPALRNFVIELDGRKYEISARDENAAVVHARKTARAETSQRASEDYMDAAGVAVVLPGVVLAIGLVLGWIVRGFRRDAAP